MRVRVVLRHLIITLLTALPWVAVAHAEDYLTEIASLGLEELLNQEVTSVLRREQSVAHAPAAIYVLTDEEIRRSGATSIPEALRLVPGLTVVRTSSSSWIVTARGFDYLGNSRLLVLIDGRTVYDPLFAGVFWDVQDLVLEDIDRIEVIRGPGAVTWGENAVNGVINIITKSAAETEGVLADVVAGKEEREIVSLRYGGKLSPSTAYRVYAKHTNRDDFPEFGGESADDDWHMVRAGFRLDSDLSPRDVLTLQGDIYEGRAGLRSTLLTSFTPPYQELVTNRLDTAGGNLLLRFNHAFSDTSQFRIQTYYDRTERHDLVSGQYRDTFDIDAQHHLAHLGRHNLVYGANYRVTTDELADSLAVEWREERRTAHLITAFAQDDIALIPSKLHLIPGTKLGYNDYTGFEYQPALKGVWRPTEVQTVWGSIARAVRLPTRLSDDLAQYGSPMPGPAGQDILLGLFGNRGADSEDLVAYELGYRSAPFRELTVDVATFYHRYDNVLSLEPGTPYVETLMGNDFFVTPIMFSNQVGGNTYGVELLVDWRPNSTFGLTATYSYMEVDLRRDPGSMDPIVEDVERRTPQNQATLRARLNLPYNIEVDTLLYFVDVISSGGAASYLRSDLRVGWRPAPNWTIDIVGQNLFDDQHREFVTPRGVEVERAVFGRITYGYR